MRAKNPAPADSSNKLNNTAAITSEIQNSVFDLNRAKFGSKLDSLNLRQNGNSPASSSPRDCSH